MTETRTPKQIAADGLDELIERLEKAEGPDRWLDAKIDAVFRVGNAKMNSGGFEWAWNNFPVWAHHKQMRGMCGVQHANGDLGLVWDSPDFTASLDAAVALAERVLTRLDLLEITYQIGGTKQHCTVETEDGEFDGINRPTLPLAICLATLNAVRVHMHPRDREEQNDG